MSEKKYLPVPVSLQESHEFDGAKLDKLTMRPPQAQDVFNATAMTRNDMERDALLFANLTDTTPDFIKELAFFDYKRVEGAYGLFMLTIAQHLERRFSFCPEQLAAEPSTTSAGNPSTN